MGGQDGPGHLAEGDPAAAGAGGGGPQRDHVAVLEEGAGVGPERLGAAPRQLQEGPALVPLRATAPGTRGGRIALGEVTGTVVPAR